MSGHSPEEVRKHVGVYYKVFGALMVLTCVTVAVAQISWTIGLAIFIFN